jgi:hypothetical protein
MYEQKFISEGNHLVLCFEIIIVVKFTGSQFTCSKSSPI